MPSKTNTVSRVYKRTFAKLTRVTNLSTARSGAFGLLALASFCAAFVCSCRHAAPNPTPPPTAFAPIRLVDVAKDAGVDYAWPKPPGVFGTKEAFGCGCAFIDYDNSGWQDILLVARPHPLLYRNLGNGRFEDVTQKMGLARLNGFWTGCAVGDYDGDGYLDILLTGYKCLALLKNDNGKGFIDTTKSAGLDPTNQGKWGSGAGFMDLAGHGRLDLVILNYVVLPSPQDDYCRMKGTMTGCPPSHYKAEYPELWENVGTGKFKDVTEQSGLLASAGKNLVLGFIDLTGSGRPGVFIGNDGTTDAFFENEGEMRFKDIGQRLGLATTQNGETISTMSADWADYDRDGRFDFFTTNFSHSSFQLFHNIGQGLFEHTENQAGVSTNIPLGFGAKWADLDNKGWPDLLCLCGNVYELPGSKEPADAFKEPSILFYNENGKKFVDIAPEIGGALMRPILGRGLASGDYDNDGRIDFLAVDLEGPALLLHNETRTSNHWITLDLRSPTANRFAYGAQVTARNGKDVWVGYVSPASSYLSSSDPRLHFGLGQETHLETITIRWPSGKTQVLKNIAADHIWRVDEGQPAKIESPAPPSP